MRVGIIGGSIEGLPAQCLEASGDARRWDVVYLNRERAARLKSPILRYLAILLEFLWATIRIPLVDVVLVVFVNRLSSWYVRSAHLFGKKCVLYWLGSDVRTLGEDLLSDGGLREADAQISYSEGNIVELRKCGVDAQLLVLPTRLSDRVADMPDSHAVLLSLPDARKEFYGYRDLMRLVDDYPDVEFHVVRSNHPEYYDRSNIVFEGMLDREQRDTYLIACRYRFAGPSMTGPRSYSWSRLSRASTSLLATLFPVASRQTPTRVSVRRSMKSWRFP